MLAAFPISKIRPLRGQIICVSGNVFAPDGELLRGFDAHLDTAAGSTQERDLYRAIRKQLGHGHVRIHTVSGLDNDRLIGSTAED
jgi:hypothetical protein